MGFTVRRRIVPFHDPWSKRNPIAARSMTLVVLALCTAQVLLPSAVMAARGFQIVSATPSGFLTRAERGAPNVSDFVFSGDAVSYCTAQSDL